MSMPMHFLAIRAFSKCISIFMSPPVGVSPTNGSKVWRYFNDEKWIKNAWALGSPSIDALASETVTSFDGFWAVLDFKWGMNRQTQTDLWLLTRMKEIDCEIIFQIEDVLWITNKQRKNHRSNCGKRGYCYSPAEFWLSDDARTCGFELFIRPKSRVHFISHLLFRAAIAFNHALNNEFEDFFRSRYCFAVGRCRGLGPAGGFSRGWRGWWVFWRDSRGIRDLIWFFYNYRTGGR